MGRHGAAIAALSILAVPGVLYGLFVLLAAAALELRSGGNPDRAPE